MKTSIAGPASAGVVAAARPRFNYRWAINVWGLVFCLPALGLLLVFKFLPVLQAVALSFTSYDLLSPPRFVGLDNYRFLLSDPNFHQSATASVAYVVGTTLPTWALALGVALLLNRRLYGRPAIRLVYFMPVLITQIVVAVLWKFLLQPDGFVNANLQFFGASRIPWLSDAHTAMLALILVALWRLVPYFMVVFLAGLQAIPHDYYEASSIEGAGPWAQFRYITLPLLRPTVLLVVVMTMLFSVRQFLYPLVLTNGGPAGATRVIPLNIFETGFSYLKMGMASSMATVLFVCVMLMTILLFRVVRES